MISGKFRKRLIAIDLFKHYEIDESKYHHFHLLLDFLFIGLMVAFIIVRIIDYVERPEVQTFQFELTSDVGAFQIDLSMECLNSNGTCGDVQLIQFYSGSQGCTQYGDQLLNFPSLTVVNNITLWICFDSDTSRGIELSFSNITGSSFVRTISRSGKMVAEVDMESSQRKAIVFALSVTQYANGSQIVTPFLNNLEYDGKTIGTQPSILSFRLQQFANLFITSRPGSVLSVLSDIGGAAGLLLSIMKLLTLFIPYPTPPQTVGVNLQKVQ